MVQAVRHISEHLLFEIDCRLLQLHNGFSNRNSQNRNHQFPLKWQYGIIMKVKLCAMDGRELHEVSMWHINWFLIVGKLQGGTMLVRTGFASWEGDLFLKLAENAK